jgi:amidophosphoribosyltransferase
MAFVRNHYVGRSFLQPSQFIRDFNVRVKLNLIAELVRGKRVVIVDDSIVRGTTSRKIVEMVRQAGATEVHMRISSPPTTHSCFYGIDTPERGKLLAANHDVAEMAQIIGADSLAFISLDGLYRALGKPNRDVASPAYCDACFTGDYAIPLTDAADNTERPLSLLQAANR